MQCSHPEHRLAVARGCREGHVTSVRRKGDGSKGRPGRRVLQKAELGVAAGTILEELHHTDRQSTTSVVVRNTAASTHASRLATVDLDRRLRRHLVREVVAPFVPPPVNLVAVRVHRLATVVEMAVNGQALTLFPSSHRRHIALQVRADFLPGVQPVIRERGLRGLRRARHVFSHGIVSGVSAV